MLNLTKTNQNDAFTATTASSNISLEDVEKAIAKAEAIRAQVPECEPTSGVR